MISQSFNNNNKKYTYIHIQLYIYRNIICNNKQHFNRKKKGLEK